MEDYDNQYAALIGSNDDLLTEILIRLPVTSILRFKSVFKHWLLLLTHKHFTNRYDNNNLSKSPLGLFVANDVYMPFDVKDRSTPPFRSLDFNDNSSDVIIMHSCNGLLLCSAVHNDDINIDTDTEYYVFNPTTKQLAFIPSVPKNALTMALAFHPAHHVHYKVVCIRVLKPRCKNMFQIQVYSSETRKWKICIESFYAPKSEIDHPVYCNGAVYWVSIYRIVSEFLCFKLDAEQLQMLPLPVEKMPYERRAMYFGESRGHLHLIFHTEGKEYILKVNVYEMLKDHSGWVVKYRIQFEELLGDYPCLIDRYLYRGYIEGVRGEYKNGFEVLDVVTGNEEEDTFLVLLTGGKMIRYNVHDKSYKELYTKKNYYVASSGCHRHIETLSSF